MSDDGSGSPLDPSIPLGPQTAAAQSTWPAGHSGFHMTFISHALPTRFPHSTGQQGHRTRHTQETTVTTKTEQIRDLNDQLRQNFSEGTAVLTCGIAALGVEAVARIVKTIAIFDDFCHANDPHQEHDYGSFEADGHVTFFKIDYHDKTLNFHSPDAADRCVAERVITITLAEQY
jgi:hypothetical protein